MNANERELLNQLGQEAVPVADFDGPKEPKAIICLGGPLSGQKRADTGQNRRIFDGEVYVRMSLDVGCEATGRIHFLVLAYDGHEWEQGV